MNFLKKISNSNENMGCGTSAQIADTINQTPYVISLLGLPNVGKTSLLELYCDEYVCFFFSLLTNSRVKQIHQYIQMEL